jgi:ketosteroid isomerase-like protein
VASNVDLVRSICAGWERGDFHSSREWAHPEIEFVIADGPSPGTWTGPDAADGYREVLSAWNEYRAEADEYRELDDVRVLVLFHLSGRGKTSGLEIGQMRAQATNVFHIRDGQATRIIHYFDRERALADLGLAPEAGSP